MFSQTVIDYVLFSHFGRKNVKIIIICIIFILFLQNYNYFYYINDFYGKCLILSIKNNIINGKFNNNYNFSIVYNNYDYSLLINNIYNCYNFKGLIIFEDIYITIWWKLIFCFYIIIFYCCMNLFVGIFFTIILEDMQNNFIY